MDIYTSHNFIIEGTQASLIQDFHMSFQMLSLEEAIFQETSHPHTLKCMGNLLTNRLRQFFEIKFHPFSYF